MPGPATLHSMNTTRSTSTLRTLVDHTEPIDLRHDHYDKSRSDHIQRFDIAPTSAAPIQISAEVSTTGVPGTPGDRCMIFFNLEYAAGPIYWDTFLYPDAGSVPWRTLSTEVRPRGELKAIEMHIRMPAPGRLRVRRVTAQEIEPWPDDADFVLAVVGDSTDMTCYLPPPLRLTSHLELLLRDRFHDRRIDVRNLAEGGDYIKRVVECGRLEREMNVLPRCDLVTLRFGLNDASQKIEPTDFGRQLHQACDIVLRRWPDAQIVLSTTIPPMGDPYAAPTIAVATERRLPLLRLDEHMRACSAAGDSDWHRGMGHTIGRRRTVNPPDNPTGLSGDLHPNAYGARMIAEFYYENLVDLVEQRWSK